MTKQLFIGFVTEGTSDISFLESIVQRTFEDIAFECNTDLDISMCPLKVDKTGLKFIELIESSITMGDEQYGITTLCVHTDADSDTSDDVYHNKIEPARLRISNSNNDCTLITPVVPVRMMEAWMLADKELLKREIGTSKIDVELGIHKNPEKYADPKDVISDAIRKGRTELTQRRRKDLTINDLYQSIGQKIDLSKLELLSSFQHFKDEVRATYRALHYLH